jgi:DNA/RNA endonuclease G (NUC1)
VPPIPEDQAREPRHDVFISYARADAALARGLAETLWNEGFDVWFDDKIYAGAAWKSLLLDSLTSARAVVVIWSKQSVKRPWVLKEADIALKRKRLVPIRVDDSALPPRFQRRQIAMMPGWDGRSPHPEMARVIDGIARLVPVSRIENVRPGFDTGFLGVELPLPTVTGVAEEFRYLHFSVVMNPTRRLPWYVAYNIAPRNNEVQRADVWQPDPLLPASFQAGDQHFRATGFDRGHMVSPLSVTWGTRREAWIANHQTFFWTNNAPQHPLMNRHWWQCVEAWEREQATIYGRGVAFAGPVLANDDPVHSASESLIGRLRVRENFRLPRRFWKLVVFADAERRLPLKVAAYFFDQEALVKNPPRQVEPATFQVSIDRLQLETGFVFDDWVGNTGANRTAG